MLGITLGGLLYQALRAIVLAWFGPSERGRSYPNQQKTSASVFRIHCVGHYRNWPAPVWGYAAGCH